MRVDTIRDSENDLSERRLVEKYTEIKHILRRKGQIKQKWYQSVNRDSKKRIAHHFQEINELTFSWFKSGCGKGYLLRVRL